MKVPSPHQLKKGETRVRGRQDKARRVSFDVQGSHYPNSEGRSRHIEVVDAGEIM